MKKFYLFISAIAVLFVSNANAQIYGYANDLLGIPSVIDPNASGSNLSRVNGALSVVACASGFNSRNFPATATYSSALTAIQWSITPDAGYEVNVASLSTKQRRNSAGPARVRFAYSIDGVTWIDQGGNLTLATASCGSSSTLAWNMTDFTHPGTVYFRAYAFNAASTSGQHQIFDVIVTGSVTLQIIPGCTAAFACNFNPSANIDDGSCVFPGCNNPVACNYDPIAGCDDGSCVLVGDACDDGDITTSGDFIQGDCNCIGYPDNDDILGAIPVILTPQDECIPFVANLLLATTSPESQSAATTGEDIWYSFLAVTNGVNLEISSGSFDGIIELQDDMGNMLDSENVRVGVGNEIMNFDGLTEGDTYYVAIRNEDSGFGGNGFVDICLSYIEDSNLENIQLSYNPCDNAKSKFVSAYSHEYTVTSQTTLVTTTYVRVGSSYFQPRNIPGVTYNDTYDVDVDPTYYLFDALGNPETIVITTENIDVMVIGSQALMSLRLMDQCSTGSNPRGSVVAGEPFVCMSVDYEWEFTRTDIPAAPFYHLRGTANRFLVLNSVAAIQFGATYDVRIRPIFSYGAGNWGPIRCMSISPAPSSSFQSSNGIEENAPVVKSFESPAASDLNFSIYPNPILGNTFRVNLSGEVENEIVQITLRDNTGRLVYQTQFNSTNLSTTDIQPDSKLAAGLYSVTLSTSRGMQTEVILVNPF
ncbi:MAG: T9SS type A sorting domain-containing protein [Flavobacteriales bacterium]|nr:T9SS type A sorting domain-containing protein [Flavobacteriales bacterium]